jgi:hypothetical protein
MRTFYQTNPVSTINTNELKCIQNETFFAISLALKVQFI